MALAFASRVAATRIRWKSERREDDKGLVAAAGRPVEAR